MTDPLYDRLGVSQSATADEVRRAYLQLARVHHPDFHSDETARRENEREMQSINEAWSVLGDPDRRRVHDETLFLTQSDRFSAGVPTPGRYDFVPFDNSEDEIDPRLLDDVGVEGTQVARSVQVAPIFCLLGGIIGLIIGVMVNLTFLIIVGLVGLVLALLGFLAAPVMALSRSIDAERKQNRPS
ncbi:MAG: J domain-containing protein [Acidimicrobiales bacterium]